MGKKDENQRSLTNKNVVFADIVNVMKGALKARHFPAFMVYPASVCARFMYGYSFTKMRPIDSLKDNKVPILFIHGADDTYILPENSERMSRETKGYCEIHLIPGAEHAASILTAPEDYRKYVEGFLKEVLNA